jgi:hypothetical protein
MGVQKPATEYAYTHPYSRTGISVCKIAKEIEIHIWKEGKPFPKASTFRKLFNLADRKAHAQAEGGLPMQHLYIMMNYSAW